MWLVGHDIYLVVYEVLMEFVCVSEGSTLSSSPPSVTASAIANAPKRGAGRTRWQMVAGSLFDSNLPAQRLPRLDLPFNVLSMSFFLPFDLTTTTSALHSQSQTHSCLKGPLFV